MEADLLTEMTIALIIAVICAAGFTQGMTGFGFGLVAMPLLLFFMDIKEAAAVTVVLNLIVCGMTFLSTRAHFSFRQGWELVVGACLGVPLGIYALVQVNELVLLRVLGGVMLFFSINEVLLTRAKVIHLSPRLGLPIGLVSGGLSGAFNMGGPPVVAYTYSQPWSKEQIVAVLQVVFGLSAVLRLVLLGTAGLLARPLLITALWSVVPLMVAISLGQKCFSRIPQPVLKQVAFLFLGAMGIKYLLFP